MRNLYRLNSNFEFDLKTYPKPNNLPLDIIERIIELEYLFLLLSSPEDLVIMSKEPNKNLLEIWNSLNINYGKVLVLPGHLFQPKTVLYLQEKMNLIEWGDISELTNGNLFYSEDKINKAKILNSKLEQARFKISNLLDSNIRIASEFNEFIDLAKNLNFPIAVKKEFSFSGNGIRVFNSENFFTDKNFRSFKKKLSLEKLILETWNTNKITEFSYLFHGEKFISKTEMEISPRGEFLGIQLVDSKEPNFNFVKQFLKEKNLEYDSYYSVDGYTYLGEELETKTNPFSEINFRFSMGIFLYLISKKLNTKLKMKYIHSKEFYMNPKKFIPLQAIQKKAKVLVLEKMETNLFL